MVEANIHNHCSQPLIIVDFVLVVCEAQMVRNVLNVLAKIIFHIELIQLLFRIQKYIHKLFLYHNEEYQNGIDIGDLINYYSSNLPNADITDQELWTWQRKWSECSPEFRPTTLEKTIKECNDRVPNIFVLLKIGCTLPVTSCECERSFSAMRRLRAWLRVSMKTE